MLKIRSYLKKIFSLGLLGTLLLCNISTFSDSISDNDGSAFITKAEFDSLKNSFQSQIDSYNQGIDSKIDSAIATYLAGINISKKPEILFDKIKNSLGTDRIIFLNGLNGGSSSFANGLDWSFVRHYTYQGISNIGQEWKSTVGNSSQWLQTGIYYGSFSARLLDDIRSSQQSRNTGGDLYSTGMPALAAGTGTDAMAKTKYNQSLSCAKVETTGAGNGWWFKKYNSSYWTLQYFCDEMYPKINIEANFHTYLDKANLTNYLTDGGLGDTQALSTTHPAYVKWGSNPNGSIKGDDDTTSKNYYSKINQFLYKSYDTSQDYSNVQLSTWISGYGIFGSHDDLPIISDGTGSISLSDQKFYSVYYTQTGTKMQTNTLSGGTLNYTKIKQVPLWLDPSESIVNSAITGVAGEDVFLGGGAPIISTLDDDQTIKIKIYVGTSNPSYKNIDYKISDKQFVCGNYDTANGGKKLAEGTITYTSDTTGTEIEFKAEKKGKVWINIKNQNVNQSAYLLKVEVVE